MEILERLNSNEKLLDGNDVLKKYGLSLDKYTQNHQECECEVKKTIVEIEQGNFIGIDEAFVEAKKALRI